jgi:hypothetical protein
LKTSVNFGLYGGANLSDPSKLMEGTANMPRHFKIKNITESGSAALGTLLKAALADVME